MMNRMYRAVLLLALIGALTSMAGVLGQDTPLPDDFPFITFDVVIDPAPGYIYLATIQRQIIRTNGFGSYLIAMDNRGVPVFYQRTAVSWPVNFGRTAHGERYYYNPTDPGVGIGSGMDGIYQVLDDAGAVVREYRIQGDMPTQAHEFIELENGNVLLLSQPVRTYDLTQYGGSAQARVVETVIQELTPDNRVAFEWRSWEHVQLTDTRNLEILRYEPPIPVIYTHGNGLAIDLDGNIILSMHQFDELIKIDHETGDIIWRMGGTHSRNNEFTFIDDPYNGFSGQHNPQILPNGNLLLFDNGDLHTPRMSRAVEYALDEDNRTATLVWAYSDGRYAISMGSVQRLVNGNTLIGWGTVPSTGPSVTEVTPDHRVVFAFSLPSSQVTYRVYRFDQ